MGAKRYSAEHTVVVKPRTRYVSPLRQTTPPLVGFVQGYIVLRSDQ